MTGSGWPAGHGAVFVPTSTISSNSESKPLKILRCSCCLLNAFLRRWTRPPSAAVDRRINGGSTCTLQRKLVVRDLKLPALSKSYGRCCGSSHGWLIFADIYSSVTIVNPFRAEAGGGGGIIHLPPIYNDEDFTTSRDDNDSLHEFDVGKVVLSADPGLSPHKCYVIAIFSEHRELFILKSGNESWTCLDDYQDRYGHYQDGVVYAVENDGEILCCEINVSDDDPSPNNPSETDDNFIENKFKLQIVGYRLQLS